MDSQFNARASRLNSEPVNDLDEGAIVDLDHWFSAQISAMYGSDSPASNVAVDTPPPAAFSRPDRDPRLIPAQHNTGDGIHVTTSHQTRRQLHRPRTGKNENRTRKSAEETFQAETAREITENGFFSIVVPPKTIIEPPTTANPTTIDPTCLEVPSLEQAHDQTALRNKTPRRGSNIHDCPDCPEIFTNLKSLGNHAWTEHGVGAFKCPRCSKAFKRHDNLKVHVEGCLKKRAENKRRSASTEERTIRLEKRRHRVSTRNLPPMSVAPGSASPPSKNSLPVPGISPMLESPGRTVNSSSPRDQMQLDNNNNDGGILPSFPPSITAPPETRNGDQDDRTPHANPDHQQIIARLNKQLNMALEEVEVWRESFHKVKKQLRAIQRESGGALKRNV